MPVQRTPRLREIALALLAIALAIPHVTPASSTGTRRASNQPPGYPYNPSPANGVILVPLDATLSWSCTDESPATLRYDVYFGPTFPLPLVASNVATASYSPGPLLTNTGYHWRIVARDEGGLERTGGDWVFYTVGYPRPYGPTPADNGIGTVPLQWLVTDPGLENPIYCDLYFGTTDPPPLLAAGITSSIQRVGFRYTPATPLDVGTRYYWQVYSRKSQGGSMGPVWSFVAAQRGDVDADGTITLEDAACALQVAINNPSCAASPQLADVNCNYGLVWPSDALCIHRRAIGQTCLICGESLTAGGSALYPTVTRAAYWQTGNTLYALLAVSDVPHLEAFSFRVATPTNAPLIAVIRRSATNGFTALEMNAGTVAHYVGGYTLSAVAATSITEFIELRFTLSGTLTGTISVGEFTDDLAGAGDVLIVSGSWKGGGGLPVTFSRFGARPQGSAIRVAWELQSDDALQSYALYRSAVSTPPRIVVAEGELSSATGAYLDQAVEAGKTYEYEMMVRARDGDEFRSQVVTVTAPLPGLSLGANHPNPFNPQTTIPYNVPAGAAPVRVRLAIHDTSGRLVRVLVDENQTSGARDALWRGDDSDGKPVTSGVYFCVLQVGKERRAQKLVLLK